MTGIAKAACVIFGLWALCTPFRASSASGAAGGSAPAGGRRSPTLPPGQDPKGSLTTPRAKRGTPSAAAPAKPLPDKPGSLTTPTKKSATQAAPKKKRPRSASLTAPSKPE